MWRSLASLLLLSSVASAQVVLNEFSYDDASTDTHEFVELYNAGASAVDISGWTVDCGDATGCGTPPACTPGCTTNGNADFVIPGAPGSGTTVLAAGGYYVIGMAPVPNVSQVTTLTLENDMEWITLRDAWGTVFDAVSYETNKNDVCFPTAFLEGPGVYGNYVMIETLPIPLSISRIRNGVDTNNNGRDFGLMPWTPGTSNDSLSSILPVSDNFDAAAVGSSSTIYAGSFVVPRVVDPTVADANNPNAIAASPQGGNALICWDPTGGGNAGILLTEPTDQVDFECYVYIDVAPHATSAINQWESWSLGVQGTTDAFGNHPDPGGLLAGFGITGLAEPNTGIAWTYVHFTTIAGATTGVLYLVDENDGGTDNVVLFSVPITAGTNDGWQRLRLRVNGSNVEGWFGGTIGGNDGTYYSGTASQPGPGPVYFQYRELVSVNAGTRPLTIDDLRVRRHGPGLMPVLPPSPCAGSGGCAPRIGWDGGTPSVSVGGPFAATVDQVKGRATGFLVIGVQNTAPWPIDLGSFLGGTPCYWMNDALSVSILSIAPSAPCAGTGSVSLGSLAGASAGTTAYLQYVLTGDPAALNLLQLTASDQIAITFAP